MSIYCLHFLKIMCECSRNNRMYEWAPYVCGLLSVFYSQEKFLFFVLYLSHLFKADCIASPISREADNVGWPML